MQIVQLSGLIYATVRATINRFEAGGWAVTRPAPQLLATLGKWEWESDLSENLVFRL